MVSLASFSGYSGRMTDWKDKRVVVMGGTGFIGSVLVEALLERGAVVRVPIRAENYRALSKLRAKIEWIEGDLRDTDYCRRLITGMDHVFHLASYRRNVEFHRTHCADVLSGNVEMTLALVHALKEYPHTNVTFFSSANMPPDIDVIRLAQQTSNDGYVLGKAVCETLLITAAHQYKIPLLIVRPVGVYGERDTFTADSNVIPSLMVKAENDDKLVVWGSGKQQRVFLYVQDLVTAVLRLIDQNASGVHYIHPDEVTDVGSLAEMIRDIVHPGLPIVFDTDRPEGNRTIPTLAIDPSLADFPWTPLRAGLEKTYAGWKNKSK